MVTIADKQLTPGGKITYGEIRISSPRSNCSRTSRVTSTASIARQVDAVC